MSIITIRLSNFKFGAANALSQIDPSLHSPSPITTYVLFVFFFLFAPNANPKPGSNPDANIDPNPDPNPDPNLDPNSNLNP